MSLQAFFIDKNILVVYLNSYLATSGLSIDFPGLLAIFLATINIR